MVTAISIPIATGIRKTAGGEIVSALVAVSPVGEAVLEADSCYAADDERRDFGGGGVNGLEGESMDAGLGEFEISGHRIGEVDLVGIGESICCLEVSAE